MRDRFFEEECALDVLQDSFLGRNVIVRNNEVEVQGRLKEAGRYGVLIETSKNHNVFVKYETVVIL